MTRKRDFEQLLDFRYFFTIPKINDYVPDYIPIKFSSNTILTCNILRNHSDLD